MNLRILSTPKPILAIYQRFRQRVNHTEFLHDFYHGFTQQSYHLMSYQQYFMKGAK